MSNATPVTGSAANIQPNAQRVTLSAQHITDSDVLDPRFAEIVRVSVFEDHSIEMLSNGNTAEWNCVFEEYKGNHPRGPV